VVVKVILDVTKSMAFVQNADTNAYLEGMFADKADKINRGNFSGDIDIIGEGGVQLNSVVWVDKDPKSPFPDSWGWIATWAALSNSMYQLAVHISGKMWLRTKYYKNASTGAPWNSWMRVDSIDVTPAMNLGIPYQTTFQRKGKPVYKKLISFGAFPASSSKAVDTGLAYDTYEIVDSSVRILHSSGEYTYGITSDFHFGFMKDGTNWKATSTVKADLSEYTAVVEISYVEKE
jgi:hypothetical protein